MTVPMPQPRPASTVILLRGVEEVIEVLMVRRIPRGFFGGLTVFPGGAVDPEDESDLASEVVRGGQPDLRFRVAALRELAEETGIALTVDGALLAPPSRGHDLLRDLKTEGKTLDGEALTLISRWVTPEYAPTRYDTRFFLAEAKGAPPVRLDTDELVDHMWVAPTVALERHAAGELEMFLPTVSHLRWLERRSGVDDAIASAAGADGRSLIRPRRMEDGSMVPVHLPSEG